MYINLDGNFKKPNVVATIRKVCWISVYRRQADYFILTDSVCTSNITVSARWVSKAPQGCIFCPYPPPPHTGIQYINYIYTPLSYLYIAKIAAKKLAKKKTGKNFTLLPQVGLINPNYKKRISMGHISCIHSECSKVTYTLC